MRLRAAPTYAPITDPDLNIKSSHGEIIKPLGTSIFKRFYPPVVLPPVAHNPGATGVFNGGTADSDDDCVCSDAPGFVTTGASSVFRRRGLPIAIKWHRKLTALDSMKGELAISTGVALNTCVYVHTGISRILVNRIINSSLEIRVVSLFAFTCAMLACNGTITI